MPTKPVIKHRPHLNSLFPYPAGKPIEEVQREFGIKSVVKLASNENLFGPSPKAIAAGKKAFSDVHYYPEGSAYYLREALAKKLKIAPEQFIFSNGTDELIILTMLTFLARDENIIVSDKAFVRYKMAAMLNDSSFKTIPMVKSEPKKKMVLWKHDLDAMIKAINKKTRMICLSNPNNPLGSWVEKKEFEAFLKRVPKHVLVFYDEAYYEYSKGLKNQPDGTSYLSKYPNLMVTRTFSKAYGLAGLRVGYGMAHPVLIQSIERVRPPFNVNRIAQATACAALGDQVHLQNVVKQTREGIRVLTKAILAMNFKVVPSRSNFITIDLEKPAAPVAQELMKVGVIVRPLTGWGMPTLIRVTVGRMQENQRFIKALKNTM